MCSTCIILLHVYDTNLRAPAKVPLGAAPSANDNKKYSHVNDIVMDIKLISDLNTQAGEAISLEHLACAVGGQEALCFCQ